MLQTDRHTLTSQQQTQDPSRRTVLPTPTHRDTHTHVCTGYTPAPHTDTACTRIGHQPPVHMCTRRQMLVAHSSHVRKHTHVQTGGTAALRALHMGTNRDTLECRDPGLISGLQRAFAFSSSGSGGSAHACSHEHRNRYTEGHVVTGTPCVTHTFSTLSAVILGTGCLARRQAFREGGCEMNTRIPEMNPKLERCLRSLTWPGGVCDNRSPVLGLLGRRA